MVFELVNNGRLMVRLNDFQTRIKENKNQLF